MDTLPTWTDVKKKFLAPFPIDDYDCFSDDSVDEEKLMEDATKLSSIFLSTKNEIERLQEKIKTKELFIVADIARQRFTKLYAKAPHLFPKDGIPGIDDTSLLASFHILFNFISLKIVSKCTYGLTKFIDKKILGEADPIKQVFFMSIGKSIIENIEKSSNNKGILYRVTNTKGITSFLIGTVHVATYEMTQNSEMIQAVKSSNELYSELGEHFVPRHVSDNDSNNSLRFAVDHSIIELAKSHNIKNVALETVDSQRSILEELSLVRKKAIENEVEQIIKASQTPADAQMELNKLAMRHKIDNFFNIHEGVEAWQNGDEEAIMLQTERPSYFEQEIMVYGRTNRWSHELIAKLSETDFPITIAVGAGHCLGEKGLAKIFQDAGLTVQNRDGTPWHLPVKK